MLTRNKRKFFPVACLSLLLCLFSLQSNGQEHIPLEVSQNKSVHLLFPAKVKYCDAGNKEVKFTVTDNIIKLIAAKPGFPETNLTVITEDDHLYSFLVLYNKDPRRLSLQPSTQSAKKLGIQAPANVTASTAGTAVSAPAAAAPVVSAKPAPAAAPVAQTSSQAAPVAPAAGTDEAAYFQACQRIAPVWTYDQFVEKRQDVALQLRNIYISGNHLYFTLYAENTTDKDMLIDFVNFQQGDRQGIQQRIYREELKKPVYVYNKQDRVKASGRQHMVFVFEKFTIDPGKKLLIELGEKDGQRFFSLLVTAEHINNAVNLKL